MLPLGPVLMLYCCVSWHAGIACCCSSRNFSSGHRLAVLCIEKWTGAWSQSHRTNSDLLFRKDFPWFSETSVQSQVPMRLSATGPSLQGLFVTIVCFASFPVTLASWNCFLSAWAVVPLILYSLPWKWNIGKHNIPTGHGPIFWKNFTHC